jgi:hypothetical protein
MTDPRTVGPDKMAAINALFEGLPSEYQSARFQLDALRLAIHQKIAEVFQPRLNDFLRRRKPKKFWDHQELAAYVDSATSELGLCVSFQGEPALLVSERGSGDDPDRHQYAILVRAKGKRFERKMVSDAPPTLTLIAAPDSVDSVLEPLRKYAYRAGRDGR